MDFTTNENNLESTFGIPLTPVQPYSQKSKQTVLDNTVYEFVCTPTFEKFYNDDSAYGVYAFTTPSELPETKVYEKYDDATNSYGVEYSGTIVGKMQQLTVYTTYKVKAKLTFSKKYHSYSYEVVSISQDAPTSLADQRAFLKSIITGRQADTLLALYPTIVQDVMEGKDNVDLSLTKGIKEKTWDIIKNKILENFVIADVLVLLIPIGISYNRVKRLLDDEPNPQLLRQKLLKDPYVLVELEGVGFKTADKIALKLNPEFLVSKERVSAFLKTHLKEVGESIGHTWIYISELDNAVSENIIECEALYKIVLEEQKEMSTFLYVDDDKVGFSYYRDVEYKIWDKLNQLNESPLLEVSEEEIESGIKKAEERQGYEYTEEQREVIKEATKSNVVFITGKGGVGKTSIARGLLNIYGSKYMIAPSALSAKASKRIYELSGHKSSTIHRLLGATGPNEFTYNEYNPLPQSCFFVDESSMVYSGLFWNLIRAIKLGSKLIISGDAGQLPPLSWGNPFFDYLQKDHLKIFYLTKILRQAAKSGVVSASNLIRDGIDPLNNVKQRKSTYGEDQNMYFMFRTDRDELNSIAIRTYLKTIENPEIGIENCCILSSRKDGCTNSSRRINDAIQDALLSEDLPTMKYGDSKKFRLGARVMQISNSYEKNVFNGDLGKVVEVGYDGDGTEFLQVEYPEIGKVTYYKDDLKELELGYSFSIHKAQGSEYHTCIVLIDNNGWLLLDNCLLYTGLSRSKTRCLLLAEPAAYDKCIEINKSNARNTWTKFFEYKKGE